MSGGEFNSQTMRLLSQHGFQGTALGHFHSFLPLTAECLLLYNRSKQCVFLDSSLLNLLMLVFEVKETPCFGTKQKLQQLFVCCG